MELWELQARESIRDLMARYNANGDRGTYDEVVKLFAPDAVMNATGKTYRGREEIRTIFTGAAARFRQGAGGPTRVKHFTTSPQIDIDSPTSARARCWYQVIMDHGLDHWGSYKDEFTVVDGHWLFKSRRVTTDGKTERSSVEISSGNTK
jgi:uncharacterized protein (TIGR02246 family)